MTHTLIDARLDSRRDAREPLSPLAPGALPSTKWSDPDVTAKGERRARVGLKALDTLWFNTGTLCNITCVNCYIESSPTNDRLAYLAASDVTRFLDDIAALGLATREIGFTGGEPFMNKDMLAMLEDSLARGFDTLVLTNAMQPMQRPRVAQGLRRLHENYGDRLTLRVSLDHYTQALHETERGADTWDKALAGLDWLAKHGFKTAIAGRTCWGESEDQGREGYRALITERGWAINEDDPASLVLFPEMDERADTPEITEGCWGILKLAPEQMMCATSRMVVKRKGEADAKVMPCTLLPYQEAFEMGTSLAQSLAAHGGHFDHGAVKLNHPHCSKFCVLGGGACSTTS